MRRIVLAATTVLAVVTLWSGSGTAQERTAHGRSAFMANVPDVLVMVMADQLVIPSRNYAAGEREFGPANVSQGVTTIKATFTRENWPLTNQTVVLQVGIEASLDGGVTWPYGAYNFNKDTGQGGWVGGVRVSGRTGEIITQETVAFMGIPEPENPNRRVRAFTQIVSNLRTAVTLQTFTE